MPGISDDISHLLVTPETCLRTAVSKMDNNGLGVILVVDDKRHLIGVITDGDVRRGILASFDFEQAVNSLLEHKKSSKQCPPITARAGEDSSVYLKILQEHQILHLPILDEQGRVTNLVTMHSFVSRQAPPLKAVVMAGGIGQRLRPLTLDVPKPMLSVGGRPLMEIILNQLRVAGIRHVNITTHYKSEKIQEYFQNGNDFGVELSYVKEDTPLGTAGALGLLPEPKETTLVINGDILTQVDFWAMHAFHKEYNADMTVAVRRHDVHVPYGIVEGEGCHITRIKEKSVLSCFINAGIYLLEPSVYRYIPEGKSFNMTDLIQCLLDRRRMVVSFPIREHWIDIGAHEDYQRAQELVKNGDLRKTI